MLGSRGAQRFREWYARSVSLRWSGGAFETNQQRETMRSVQIKFCSCVRLVLVCLAMAQITAGLNTAAQTADSGFRGQVHDESGAAIAGARIIFRDESRAVHTTTSEDGKFSFSGLIGAGTLTIEAPDFAVFSQHFSEAALQKNLEIVLKPASIREQVTVTATRNETPLAATAASVHLLSLAELSMTAALTIDDALRQVPGFQLFRRSGSRTANPTSQGVSLRGVGASGASRALVLADGLPFADPFGGWIYWDRMPRAAVNQLEVVRGGASDLYGNSAMGGVINIITRARERPALSLDLSYGNQNSPSASIYAGTRLKKFSTSLAGELFQTNGYINVRKNDRGAVDTPVSSRHRSLYVDIGYEPSETVRLFVKPSYFAESRANGTPLQTNRTHVGEIVGGANLNPVRVGEIYFRGYLSRQTYDQMFSAIATNRNTETLTRIQRVPAQSAGLIFQWSRSIGNYQSLVGGLEAREVRGASDEIVYDRGKAASLVGAGGRQRSYALFFTDSLHLHPRLSVCAGARLDLFRNLDGLSVGHTISPGAPEIVTRFTDVTELAFSPHLSILYNANTKLSFFGSWYGAFRAPTLNELYRSFRVGNVITVANENLKRERARGGEAGARLGLWEDRFDLRASFFALTVSDPIANVTLANSPALITRMRQNLGRTRSLGLEIDSNLRLKRSLNISVGYLLSNARVLSFSANPLLEGLLIPQTPRTSITFQIGYASPKSYKFGLQGRASGAQFEDDQNLLRLPGFFTLDGYVARNLNHRLEIFVAGENVFNSRYQVGRTPVVTVGPSTLFRAGLKMNY
jgi:outer membrane receptor protein involved in Fe transport